MTEEVFRNYFNNAIQYADGDKQIRVSVTPLEDVGKVRIGVFNTGRRIDEDVKKRLWDKFYKADKARSREYGGSAIVLSIVKAMMEAMGQGGRVRALDVVLPVGISFYIFQALSYTMDVYRGEIKATKNLPEYAPHVIFQILPRPRYVNNKSPRTQKSVDDQHAQLALPYFVPGGNHTLVV